MRPPSRQASQQELRPHSPSPGTTHEAEVHPQDTAPNNQILFIRLKKPVHIPGSKNG
jgi:hypothetical protein